MYPTSLTGIFYLKCAIITLFYVQHIQQPHLLGQMFLKLGKVCSILVIEFSLVLSVFCDTATSKRDEVPSGAASKLTMEYKTDCSTLKPGQFLCLDLNIDPVTQQPKNCHPELHYANITCQSAPGIICNETGNSTFTSTTPCSPTNGHNFETALLLSIFLGMFGLDRFYLGYPAIGLAKLSTLGFFFLGQLIDVVLIATQTIGPADGSHYVISYYGAAINVLSRDNDTYLMPQPDWDVTT